MVHVLTTGRFFPWKAIQQLTTPHLPSPLTILLSIKNNTGHDKLLNSLLSYPCLTPLRNRHLQMSCLPTIPLEKRNLGGLRHQAGGKGWRKSDYSEDPFPSPKNINRKDFIWGWWQITRDSLFQVFFKGWISGSWSHLNTWKQVVESTNKSWVLFGVHGNDPYSLLPLLAGYSASVGPLRCQSKNLNQLSN